MCPLATSKALCARLRRDSEHMYNAYMRSDGAEQTYACDTIAHRLTTAPQYSAREQECKRCHDRPREYDTTENVRESTRTHVDVHLAGRGDGEHTHTHSLAGVLEARIELIGDASKRREHRSTFRRCIGKCLPPKLRRFLWTFALGDGALAHAAHVHRALQRNARALGISDVHKCTVSHMISATLSVRVCTVIPHLSGHIHDAGPGNVPTEGGAGEDPSAEACRRVYNMALRLLNMYHILVSHHTTAHASVGTSFRTVSIHSASEDVYCVMSSPPGVDRGAHRCTRCQLSLLSLLPCAKHR